MASPTPAETTPSAAPGRRSIGLDAFIRARRMVWTWEPDGVVRGNWWTDDRLLEALDRWRQMGEMLEVQAKWSRDDAAREAGLTKGP